jgi:hypothetical protein
MNTHLGLDRSPWLTRHELPCIPSPTTPRARSSLLRCPPSVTDSRNLVTDRLSLCPVGVSQTSGRPRAFARVPVWTSPLMRRLVATYGRNVFALLRTASSPQVALHPASRRRSYLWLSGVGISRERTCTSQIAPAPRRTHSRAGGNPKMSLDTRFRGYDERDFHTKAGDHNSAKNLDSGFPEMTINDV